MNVKAADRTEFRAKRLAEALADLSDNARRHAAAMSTAANSTTGGLSWLPDLAASAVRYAKAVERARR